MSAYKEDLMGLMAVHGVKYTGEESEEVLADMLREKKVELPARPFCEDCVIDVAAKPKKAKK